MARSRLDRYEELRGHLKDWRDVRIVLDRREGERQTPQPTFAGVDQRRVERRQGRPDLRKLVNLLPDLLSNCSERERR